MQSDTAKQFKKRQDEQIAIDTSKMNEEQRAAMEVAESARDFAAAEDGFAAELFMGRFRPDLIMPFPEQTATDKAIGDELVAKVSSYLREHLDADEVDRTQTIPESVVTKLKEMGVFKMKVPKEYGGLGFSQVNYNRVMMAISSHCGSTAVLISAHQSIGVPNPLKMVGTDAQKAKYLPRISEGDISAFALTEPEVGSDPAKMTTTAVLSEDGSHYILNGVKQWTTNGPIAQLFVVMAKTVRADEGESKKARITAFIVEADTPGIETLHRCDFMGLRGIQNGIMGFKDVKVPVENVLWGEGTGLKLALKTLNTGRLTLPAACAGLAKHCVSISRRWASKRVQWGLAVGEHEAGREKLAYIASTAFAIEAVTWLTSHWADQDRDIRIDAAMAKLFCSEAAWQVVDTTMQLRGGRGYERSDSLKARGEDPFPVERMMRDTRINTIIEGTSDIMRLFLAREALDPHLRLGADLLHPKSTPKKKMNAAMGMLGFYSRWYPRRLVGIAFPSSHNSTGRLATHMRFIDRGSHRLAAGLFHAMGKHQAKLEKRQVLLAHLMDIGTELFAMSATCAYATAQAKNEDREGALDLADVFCRQARRRVDEHVRLLGDKNQKAANSLAERLLNGRYSWLEEGVIAAEDAA